MESTTGAPRKNRVFLMVAAMGMLLIACDSTSVKEEDPPPLELAGKWGYFQASYTVEKKTTPPSFEFPDTKLDTVMDLTGEGYFLDLKGDSSMAWAIPRISFELGKAAGSLEVDVKSGTWSVSGSVLSLRIPGINPIVFEAQTKEGNLMLTSIIDESRSEEGYTFTSKRTVVFRLEET